MAGQGRALVPPQVAATEAHSRTAGGACAVEEACRAAADQIERYGMLGAGDHVLAAFSGGADSTALALVLRRLGYRITLAHVDHGMRADSELDSLHCRSFGRRLDMGIEQVRVNVVPATEANARRLRYQALQGIAERVGADRIATGHTLNDEAETVKMRLARGGFGLGIPPVRGNIIRPLLTIGRRLTEAVCRESGVLYLEDPTNTDLRITRNRIRKELSQAPSGEIGRFAAVGAESRARKSAVEARLRDFRGPEQIEGETRLELAAVLAAPDAVARDLVRSVLRTAGVEPSGRLVADILAKVVPHPGSSLDLPGGLSILSEREASARGSAEERFAGGAFLVVRARTRPADPLLPEAAIEVPGITVVPDWGLRVSVSIEPAKGAWERGRYQGSGAAGGRYEEVFDAGVLAPGLRLRQWRSGDRFYPLGRDGAPGRKKLHDFFVDAKVPRAERHQTPLITSDGEIAWVVGHRIDDRFKVTGLTRTVARIKVYRPPQVSR